MAYVELACRCLLAVVFAASVFGKARSRTARRAFASWIAGVRIAGVGSRKPAVIAAAAVAVEAAIVGMLVVPATVQAGQVLAVATLAVFTGVVWAAVRRGVRVPCRCFGASTTPLGLAHVVRNGLLCAVAFIGAASSGATGGERPAGVAVTLASAAVLALPVLFFDDLAELFGASP